MRNAANKAGLTSRRVRRNVVFKNFLPALHARGWFFAITFFGGCVLLIAGYLMSRSGVIARDGLGDILFEHLGVAFVVTATAVFGYEWNAHINETNDLNEQVKQEIGESRELRFSLGLTSRLLAAMGATGKSGLEPCLDAFLGYDGRSQCLADVRKQFMELAQAVVRLRERPSWTTDSHISFLSVLLDSFVIRNAKSLGALAGGHGEHHFKINETSQAIVGKILVKQMQIMMSPDEYLVVSDLLSWRGGSLGSFLEESTRGVCERGVKIRRLFNLVRDKGKFSTSEARDLLSAHIKAMNESEGEYEVRFLTDEGAINGEDISDQHYGLFVHGEEMILFKVEREDLSDLSISIDEALTAEAKDKFTKLWGRAAKASDLEEALKNT